MGTRIPSTIRRKKAAKISQASLSKPVVPATLEDHNFKACLGCRVSAGGLVRSYLKINTAEEEEGEGEEATVFAVVAVAWDGIWLSGRTLPVFIVPFGSIPSKEKGKEGRNE